MKNTTYKKLEKFVDLCISRRRLVFSMFFATTFVMLVLALNVKIKTVFEDLVPTNHEYVKVHKKYQKEFGGTNVVSIMIEAKSGDIFNTKTLAKIKQITVALEQVDGVNQFQIISLASKKLREIRASTESIETRPVMWPEIPSTEADLQNLKNSVRSNPLIYGSYVSKDLKSALITADFYENQFDYKNVFRKISEITKIAEDDETDVHVVGEPILYGWVDKYLPETLNIFALTVVTLIFLLFLVSRTWHGTLLPLFAGLTSAIWALGTATIVGYNLDPLVIVIAFLITARSISHSVQLVTRYDEEMAGGCMSSAEAAKNAMLQLFKPGILGVVADAGCMMVVILTPIPLMQKVAVIGSIWVMTIAISACVMTPVLLSWKSTTNKFVHPVNVSFIFEWMLNKCVSFAESKYRYISVILAAIIFVGSGYKAFDLKVGDADPGSPILWQDSEYNRDAADINEKYQGADRMYVVFEGNKPDAVKEPSVLKNMAAMQSYMSNLSDVGGSLGITDIIPAVRRLMHENNPRYEQFGLDKLENGELLFMFKSGSDPGDMERFVDTKYQNAAINIYFKDHQGSTVQTAISRVKEFISKNPLSEGGYVLAGGLVGVVAAVNEVIFSGQVESIALALLVLVICCAIAYRSIVAGMFFMVPVILSNTVTFAYMAANGIGMNLSTLPVAALGIGLGVDYSFYIVDGIKESLHHNSCLLAAIRNSLLSAGKGVLVTSATLTACVVLWFYSSLRFQSDMGTLMAVWLGISSISALLLMPAMVYIFKPDFILNSKLHETDV